MSKSEEVTATSPVLAKLKAHRAAQEGTASLELAACGVTVTYPKFINHGRWMKAVRLGQRDMAKAQTLLLVDVCRFDGERLTLEDFESLIPAGDAMELVGEVMGGFDDDDEGDDVVEPVGNVN